MGHSHGHEGNKTDPFTLAMLVLVVIFLAVAVVGNLEAIFLVAGKYFQLTRWDVMMIPVGTISFGAFWYLSEKLIFAPHILLVEEREAMTSGAEDSASDALKEAEELLADYKQKILEARIEAAQEKMKILADARKAARGKVERANERAKERLTEARAEVNSQLESMREKVMADADALVEDIVDRVKAVPEHTQHSVH